MNQADRKGVYEVIEAMMAIHVKAMHPGGKHTNNQVFCPICERQMIPVSWSAGAGSGVYYGWQCGCTEVPRWKP